MRHPKLLLSTLVFLLAAAGTAVFAQDPNTGDNSMNQNKSASPSGNSSVILNANAAIRTDLYTGRLQVSLPLFTLESSDVKVPISLNYTAGNGVRPSDLNTQVGMDWTLASGGSITRVVKGLPDDADLGYMGSNYSGRNGANNMGEDAVTAFNNYSQVTTISLFSNDANHRAGKSPIDGEPDVFYLNTPLFSAQFTCDQNGIPVFQNNTGLKIVHHLYNNSFYSAGTGFTVTDDQGNVYTFGTQLASREMTTTTLYGQSFTFVSTWYLEKIVLFNSKDVITFNYWQGNDYSVFNYMQSKSYVTTYPSGSGFPPNTSSNGFNTLTTRNIQVNTVTYNGPKYISQIITKLGEADFTYTYNSTSSVNSYNPPTLSTITVKQFDPQTMANDRVLEALNLNYTDIFTGIAGWTLPYPYPDLYGLDYRRLLSSISVTGNTPGTSSPLTLYNLKYYQQLPYPDRNLPQNCDYWGYPNTSAFSADGGSGGGADTYYYTNPDQARQPSIWNPPGSTQEVPTAAIFALQELDDVNGGATTFNYELNTIYSGGWNMPVGGTRVSSIVHSIPGGASLTTGYNYNDANGNSTGQLWNDFYKRVTMEYGSSCCSFNTLALSQSIYGIADDNGVSVGYSAVKTIAPSGGYEIDNFSNFSDYPDAISSTPSYFAATAYGGAYPSSVLSKISSFSYKRGLLTSSAIYTSTGKILSQVSNTYGSLDYPTVAGIAVEDASWILDGNNTLDALNLYNMNIENWRLLQTARTDYDQLNTNNSISATSTYTYNDKRLISSITTTDSKGQSHVQTFYHADDNTIPMVTSSEQTAINTMLAANRTNVVIHMTDSRNGVIHQTHHSYAVTPVLNSSVVYLASDATYAGSTLQSQNAYNYDASTSQLVSASTVGDKPLSVSYGYNSTYPVAKVMNASNTATVVNQVTTLQGTVSIPGGGTGGYTATFTTNAIGSIIVTLPPGQWLATQPNGAIGYFNVSISGAGSGSGYVCYSSNPGYTCSSTNSVTFPNMPAGNYTLLVQTLDNTAASNFTIGINYNYQGYQLVPSGTTEYFFEGFEQNSLGTAGSAHTGTMYYGYDYTVPYTMPNSRQYLIQWWSLVNGRWVFNEQPYVNGMTLSGPIDDVRVFPADALMTTFTYSPLLGRTSETSPAGITKTFEYDGLGRLLRERDQNGNILKQYDYQNQVGLQQ